ncbi:MAG: transporter substrate-binding domain-containing protein [Clostridia bacterium]|nr:transporter substrate-binding domain-containing protein [Clostridia bacterium]
MKKKHLIFAVAMLLALMLLGLSCGALAEGKTFGVLSFLNVTEEEDHELGSIRQPMREILLLDGVLEEKESNVPAGRPAFRYYDSLNAMLMALQAGEVNAITVPYYTGKYLCSANDNLMLTEEYHPEKATEITDWALSLISSGYSFMIKEENTELRDAFDAQITAMKEDGTLQKLIDEYIIKASDGGEPIAIAFEKFEGDPIKIAVTGSLPPMDYVAADGTFAGFNTAVLSEIGKRLQKNIELVQVDSVGRALALSEGTVDVVFWTRGMSETIAEHRHAHGHPSEEQREANQRERLAKMSDEEKAIMEKYGFPDAAMIGKYVTRDLPAGAIITQPYFSDFPATVTLK